MQAWGIARSLFCSVGSEQYKIQQSFIAHCYLLIANLKNTTYVEFIKPAGIVRKCFIFRRMKMKKNLGLLVFCISTVALIGFGSCVSLNDANYAQGKFINSLFLNQYDSSVAVEEQCYVIVLSGWTGISTIDGKIAGNGKGISGAVQYGSMTIVPQGKRTFSWLFERGMMKSQSGELEFELEAGNYYFLTVEQTGAGSDISVSFDNLKNHTEPFMLWGKTADAGQKPISAQSIIEGMNAKIRTKFPNFAPK